MKSLGSWYYCPVGISGYWVIVVCNGTLRGRNVLFTSQAAGGWGIYQVSNKKATQAFDSCWRTRVPILFKLTMNIVRKMAKIIVIKGNSLDVLPHLECVLHKRLHFCCFHWTRRSFLKKFGWDHPKTFDFKKWPEQKDKSLRTPLASNYDRNRLWDARQDCQPPPFGGPWACPRWSAGSEPTTSAFFKSLLRVTYEMFMLITYITCFAIYLTTQQCINFYFRGNFSSLMNENNSSRFFWTPGTMGNGDSALKILKVQVVRRLIIVWRLNTKEGLHV